MGVIIKQKACIDANLHLCYWVHTDLCKSIRKCKYFPSHAVMSEYSEGVHTCVYRQK